MLSEELIQIPLAGDMASEYLYGLMTNIGCRLENASLASMISMYGKQKKLAQAQKVFASIADSTTDGKLIFGAMIDAYITCGREEDAYLFCKEQATRGHNLGPVSISILVKALTSCGKRCYPFNVFWIIYVAFGVIEDYLIICVVCPNLGTPDNIRDVLI